MHGIGNSDLPSGTVHVDLASNHCAGSRVQDHVHALHALSVMSGRGGIHGVDQVTFWCPQP